MPAPLVGAMLTNSVLFGVESNSSRYFHLENPTYENLAIRGAIAGFVTGIRFCCFDEMKLKIFFY